MDLNELAVCGVCGGAMVAGEQVVHTTDRGGDVWAHLQCVYPTSAHPTPTNPRFDAVLARMKALHDRKSGDYASDANRYSNFEFAAALSAQFSDPIDCVFATLIGVKMARLIELTQPGRTPNNESLEDTRIDLANYAALWASYFTQPS